MPSEFLKSFTPEIVSPQIVSPHNGNNTMEEGGCDMCTLEDDEIDELLASAEGKDKVYK